MVYIVGAGFPRPLYVLILSSPHHIANYGWSIHVSDRAGKPRPYDSITITIVTNIANKPKTE